MCVGWLLGDCVYVCVCCACFLYPSLCCSSIVKQKYKHIQQKQNLLPLPFKVILFWDPKFFSSSIYISWLCCCLCYIQLSLFSLTFDVNRYTRSVTAYIHQTHTQNNIKLRRENIDGKKEKKTKHTPDRNKYFVIELFQHCCSYKYIYIVYIRIFIYIFAPLSLCLFVLPK